MLDLFSKEPLGCNSVVGMRCALLRHANLLVAVLHTFHTNILYFLLGNFLFCCVIERTLERAFEKIMLCTSSGILIYLILLPRMWIFDSV